MPGKRKSRSRAERFSVNHQKSWLWGRHVVEDTLRSGRWPIIDLFLTDAVAQELSELLTQSTSRGIIHQVVSAQRLEELAHTADHQGLIARMGAFPYPSVVEWNELLSRCKHASSLDLQASPLVPDSRHSEQSGLFVLCDRIQDAFNFGAILRSCDATQVSAVVIGRHEQVGVTSQVARSSAGAVNHVPIHRTDDLPAVAAQLRSCGLAIVAASEKAALPMWQANLSRPTALLIGSESHGLSPELINCCDLRVSIPMLGTGTSLNAAVATGVLLYEIRRQQRPEHRIADRLAMESDLKDVSII